MKEKLKKLIKSDWMFYIIAGSLIILLRVFVIDPVRVDGVSMMPNLENKERIWAIKHQELSRFDIVNLIPPDDEDALYIKRVIGLPGESIRYQDDQLYVDDKPVAEPFLDKSKKKLDDGELLTQDYSLETSLGIRTIPNNYYLVLGDNRQHSNDGRLFGLVHEKNIVSTAKVIYWPPKDMGFVGKDK